MSSYQGRPPEARGAIDAMSSPETVVLMSVYGKDRPSHFREAVSSILNQTYRDFHLFLILDGPVGAPLEACIAELDDGRIKVFRNPANRGLAVCLNMLIEEANKDGYRYLARMDSDDVADPSRLAKQVEFLVRNPAVDVVGTFCEEVDEAGVALFLKKLPTHDTELKRAMLERCPFIHPTVMFRGRVLESSRYHTDTHLTEDMFLWVDLARAGFVFANIPEPLLKYRIGADFFGRRRGLRKAWSEFRAKLYIGRQLSMGTGRTFVVALLAFILRVLPGPALRVCYRYLR